MKGIQEIRNDDGSISYRAQVRVRGFKSISKSFKRKTDAKRWKERTESDLRRAKFFPEQEARKRTVKELIKRYREETFPHRRSIDGPKLTLKFWEKKLGHLTLDSLSPSAIREVWDELAKTKSESTKKLLSTRSLNSYLETFAAALNVAVREYGWLQVNPAANIRRKKLPRGRDRYLSKDELKAFLEKVKKSSNPLLYPAVLVSLTTGGRKTEVLSLQWKDVDLKNGSVTFRDTKNGETRTVPLVGTALEEVKKLAEEGRFTSEYVFASRRPKWKMGQAESHAPWEDLYRPFRDAVQKAKIKNFRWHDMRHCAASYLLDTGASLAEVGKILGHKTPQMTYRYSHLVKGKDSQLVEMMVGKHLAGL